MSDIWSATTPLEAQERLQRETYGLDYKAMSDEQRIPHIKDMVLALTDELHEALAEVGWKPWATSRHINQEALRGELIDAYHFLMNLFLLADMDDEEVHRRYFEKHNRNRQRQAQGYDGVAGKCPQCGRALDDLVYASPWVDVETDLVYCSLQCWRES